jgi:hypothetical protein
LALEGILIDDNNQFELSNDYYKVCNNNESNYHISDYLNYIYNSINNPTHFANDLNHRYPSDCVPISTANALGIYFASSNNLVASDIYQESLYLVSNIFKSHLTITSTTFLFVITAFGSIAAILEKKFWKIKNQRKSFTQLTRKRILTKQKNRCAYCNRILVVVDFDHKNGNRADNRQVNCQALCPNCHAIKTRQRTIESKI